MKGRDLRDAGIARVSIGREDWIAKARNLAVSIAKRSGQVTINDVRRFIDMPDDFHPNTWGAVLRGDTFEPECKGLLDEYLRGKKQLWGLVHDITHIVTGKQIGRAHV